MKPLMLRGHSSPITSIVYTRDSQYIVSSSKTPRVNIWNLARREYVGSYDGHTGAVYGLALGSRDTLLVTGAADRTVRMWDVETGKCIADRRFSDMVNGVSLSERGTVLVTTRNADTKLNSIHVLDGSLEPKFGMAIKHRPTRSCFLEDESMLVCDSRGSLIKYDATGKELLSERVHEGAIADVEVSADKTFVVTASKDHTAKVIDTEDLKVMRAFNANEPVNAVSVSSLRDELLLGGGIEARDVTTSSYAKSGFDIKIYSMKYEQLIGTVGGHFGTINAARYSPDGKGFASGGEEGVVRVHFWDEDYYEYDYADYVDGP